MDRRRITVPAATLAAAAILLPLGAAVALILSGCTTAPSIVNAPAPAYSGNTANAGVIDLGPGNKGPAHVDQEWIYAYSNLIDRYGKDFTPPIKPGDGVTPLPDGTWLVDLEHLADKNVMATMERSGIPP